MNDRESGPSSSRNLQRRTIRWAAVLTVIALPLIVHGIYLWRTGLPSSIKIATGRVGGRHRVIMESLAEEIRAQLKIDVELIESDGSLMNLKLLREGRADLALYQSGAERMMGQSPPAGQDGLSFVTNMYSEVVHLIVSDAIAEEIQREPGDALFKKTIAIGDPNSGDRASSLLLLEHFGLSLDEIDEDSPNYDEIVRGFEEGTLDAAVISVGVQADVFRDLRDGGHCSIQSLPHIDALARNHISVLPYTIPQGLYGTRGRDFPEQDIETIALRAQLLTRTDARDTLIERVIEIALSEEFFKKHQLEELFSQGTEFARKKPEFALHEGAAHYFDPELKPLLNSDFVEGMEGMRSFIVSVLIAGYLGWRWWTRRQILSAEHRLDGFIRRLLEIERKQLLLDEANEGAEVDSQKLQLLLDDVTHLRQDALSDFSAHQLNEDRAVDCFLEMCHALSDKISAKLTRVRIDFQFQELHKLLAQKNAIDSEDGGDRE